MVLMLPSDSAMKCLAHELELVKVIADQVATTLSPDIFRTPFWLQLIFSRRPLQSRIINNLKFVHSCTVDN